MSQVFRVEYPIRFSHCDPAGIVYFPRFFDLIHQAMEDWFTYGLGERFSELVMQKGLGTPTVSTHCDFVSPARFGDTLTVELSILRLGTASVEMLFDASVRRTQLLQVPPHHLRVRPRDGESGADSRRSAHADAGLRRQRTILKI